MTSIATLSTATEEEAESEADVEAGPGVKPLTCGEILQRPQTKKYAIGLVLIFLFVYLVYTVVGAIADVHLVDWFTTDETQSNTANASVTDNASVPIVSIPAVLVVVSETSFAPAVQVQPVSSGPVVPPIPFDHEDPQLPPVFPSTKNWRRLALPAGLQTSPEALERLDSPASQVPLASDVARAPFEGSSDNIGS